MCPSEGRTALRRKPHNAFTHYLGVAGIDYRRNGGVLYLDSRTRLSDCTDGTSSTLLIGERPPSRGGSFGWWYAGWGQAKNGSAEMLLGVRERNAYGVARTMNCPAGPFHFQKGGKPCDFFHFWSRHPGGANFASVDGAVRFLGYGADSLLPSLATRSGNEIVEGP